MDTDMNLFKSPVKRSDDNGDSSGPEVAAMIEDSDSDYAFEDMVDHFGITEEDLLAACRVHPPEVYKTDFQKYAKEALLLLKDNKGEDYEFFKMKANFPIYSKGASHLNFYGRLKGTEAYHLLFAEVDHTVEPEKVVACSVVRYSDFYFPEIIIHPPGVSCIDCEYFNQNKGHFDCCGELESDEE